MLLETQNGD